MKKSRLITALAAIVLLLGATRVFADDVSFEFDIPTIPFTPVIEDGVTNSVAKPNSTFTVKAKITGRTQLQACCNGVCTNTCEPNCDFSACEMEDYYGETDPRVVPNPTCIPNQNDTSGGSNTSVCGGKTGNPKVYYYYNGDTATTSSVDMVYNSTSEEFEGVVPTTGLDTGETITYYIVAVDNRGNVVAQVPDPDNAPCGTISSWDDNYSTPPINNCTYANSYEECGQFKSGTPTCYSSDHTINDPEDDTCDVDAEPVTGLGLVDVLGVDAGAGKGYQALPSDIVVCSQISLGASPPQPGTSEGEIDAYVMVFFNPDIPDPEPTDIHMKNAFAITYAPEAAGADPNLVKVLWDGDCATDPNTDDILGCKIFIGSLNEDRLKIGAEGTNLAFISKNSLPDGRSLLGSDSNTARAIIGTGAIDLSGATPFWLVDLSVGMSIVRENQTTTVADNLYNPAPPSPLTPAQCKADGASSWESGTCPQSQSEPASNDCKITLNPSPDAGDVGSYKVYHNTVDDRQTWTELTSEEIISNHTGTNYITYTIGDDAGELLDGKTHYFYFRSEHADNDDDPAKEYITPVADASKTTCTVEDWVEPEPPDSMTCATPEGNEGNCKCTWSINTLTDPSITGFFITRDEVRQNTNLINAVENQESYDYNYTDNDEALEVMGGPYEYRAIATDAGGNESPEAGDDSDTALCTPEDLKKPSKIDTLTPALKALEFSVDLSWEQGEDEDLASGGGYNVYYCEAPVDPDTDCNTADKYTKINSSLIPHEGTLEASASDLATEDTEFCFWVEACDNCVSQGNCPSNGSEANCSNFDTTAVYRKCLIVTASVDSVKPNMPGNVDATPPATGKECDITFDRVCNGDDGNPFEDCNYPGATDLLGYYVLRTEAIGGDCSTTPIGNPGNLGSSVIAKTVYASQQTDTTHETTDDNNGEGLSNGTEYCYVVYGYDAGGNYSAGTPTPDSCTPDDTIPPARPVIEKPMDFTDFECSPSWAAVSDPDDVFYNVYRCDDTLANCNATSSYSIVTGGEAISATTLTDYVTKDEVYSYCITAQDQSDNHSQTYWLDTGETTPINCAVCTPGAVAKPDAPEAQSIYQYGNPNYGAKACWTASEDDDGSGNGYSIYACSSSACDGSDDAAGCCDKLIESGYTGSHACTTGNEWEKDNISLAGTYFIGVTYVNSEGTESLLSLTGNSIETSISYYCSIPDNYDECRVIVGLKKPLMKTVIEECPGDAGSCCEGYDECTVTGTDAAPLRVVEVPMSGVPVELVPVTGGASRSSKKSYGSAINTQEFVTSSTGSVSFRVRDSLIQSGTEYAVVVKLKGDNMDPALSGSDLCVNETGDDCVMVVRDAEEIDMSEEGEINLDDEAPPTIPESSTNGGFTGDIGNFYVDNIVNSRDLLKLKPTWMARKDGTSENKCYRYWADINSDGVINSRDLLIVKDYWMKNIDDSNINEDAPGARVPAKDPTEGDPDCE